MDAIKLPDLEKILKVIPIEKAQVEFSIDRDSGFDYFGIDNLAQQIRQVVQEPVSLATTPIKGESYCKKKEVLRLYSEWFSSETEKNENLNLIVPLPWQGKKTLKIEHIRLSNLHGSRGMSVDIDLVGRVVNVDDYGANGDSMAKIQSNLPDNFELRYKRT
ncbi:MAG: hypothetical protein AABW63_01300 [Nanoarchaeota archaeon]